MAARRTERLLNLIICLLHTRSFLSAERIRDIVPGYEDATDEAFKRMFERDKEDLRDLGIPLENGTDLVDDEPGYRVPRAEYALPDISLDPDEAAAVGLAARMWSSATLGGPATRALRKLEAAGVERVALPEGLQPRIDSGGSGFPVLGDAVRAGRRVRFDYRGATDAAASRRRVEPWGVVWWRGRWYLAGRDLDRDGTRVFRLSRMVGEPVAEGPAGAVTVPAGIDLTAVVSASDSGSEPVLAQVKVRRGRAIGLRRAAVDTAAENPDWELLTLRCPDVERLVDLVLPYGPDAVIMAPAVAREAIVGRLRAVAG